MNPYVNIGVGIDTSLPFIFSQKCALLRPSSWMIKLNFIKTLPHCSLLYQISFQQQLEEREVNEHMIIP